MAIIPYEENSKIVIYESESKTANIKANIKATSGHAQILTPRHFAQKNQTQNAKNQKNIIFLSKKS